MLEFATLILAVLYLCGLPVGIPLAIVAILTVIAEAIYAIYRKSQE